MTLFGIMFLRVVFCYTLLVAPFLELFGDPPLFVESSSFQASDTQKKATLQNNLKGEKRFFKIATWPFSFTPRSLTVRP